MTESWEGPCRPAGLTRTTTLAIGTDTPAPESYAEFGNDTARRPRVRNTEEQFESRLLPLFVHRIRKVAELILLKKFGGISLKSERLYYRKCA